MNATGDPQSRANSKPRRWPLSRQHGVRAAPSDAASVYGALDLGTNNCRLLLAEPGATGFAVVDAFSRIVRLGEGASRTGRLDEQAMRRTIDALRVCANKLIWRKVKRRRLVATEACRVAENGLEFIDRVKSETGLWLEVIDRQTEAELAVAGAAPLIAEGAEKILVFDIGGGSTEIVWLEREAGERADPGLDIAACWRRDRRGDVRRRRSDPGNLRAPCAAMFAICWRLSGIAIAGARARLPLPTICSAPPAP